MKRSLWVALAILALGVPGVISLVLAGDKAEPVTAQEAKSAAATAQVDGKLVEIEGKLDNAGTNYFTDRRIILRDETGEIDVQAWLPLTAAQPHDDGSRPEVLSDYLGKQVVLIGMVTKQPAKGVVGGRATFVVENASLSSK